MSVWGNAVCEECGNEFTVPDAPLGGFGFYDARCRYCPDHLAVWRADRDQRYAKAAELRARFRDNGQHAMSHNGHEKDADERGEPYCINCGATQSDIDAVHAEWLEYLEDCGV